LNSEQEREERQRYSQAGLQARRVLSRSGAFLASVTEKMSAADRSATDAAIGTRRAVPITIIFIAGVYAIARARARSLIRSFSPSRGYYRVFALTRLLITAARHY